MIINTLEHIQAVIINRYYYHPGWIMALMVFSVMIVGYCFSTFRSRVIAVVKAFFSFRLREYLLREEYSLSHPASVFLSCNFLLVISLFILLAMGSFYSSLRPPSLFVYLIIFSSVFVVYFIKIITVKIAGFLFDKPMIASEYIFIIYLVNQAAGIVFIPVVIFVAYAKPELATIFVYIGIFLFGLAFIARIGKGIAVVLSNGEMNPFYLLLYLCTLEILPWLFAWKLLEKV